MILHDSGLLFSMWIFQIIGHNKYAHQIMWFTRYLKQEISSSITQSITLAIYLFAKYNLFDKYNSNKNTLGFQWLIQEASMKMSSLTPTSTISYCNVPFIWRRSLRPSGPLHQYKLYFKINCIEYNSWQWIMKFSVASNISLFFWSTTSLSAPKKVGEIQAEFLCYCQTMCRMS